MKKIDEIIEGIIFKSRWLLAPFFVGLILAIIVLLGKFIKEIVWLFSTILTSTGSQTIISILTLLDTTLIACLVIIIIFSGYEIFISRIEVVDNDKKLSWMGKISFSDLKLKLITAIVAISTVELLREIVNIENSSNEIMAWKIGVQLTFVFTGVFFALTDLIISKKNQGH